jgi:hypothetical protein
MRLFRDRTASACALAFTAMLVAMSSAGVAAAATAPPVGTFTVRPANPNPTDPSSQAYFTLPIGARQTSTDQIAISNPTSAPITVLISGVDGLTSQTSGAVYANRQDKVKKAGLWIAVSTNKATLAPNSTRDVSFTVKVPSNASVGDHLAGIAVENSNPRTTGKGFRIREVLRTVIGVLVKVPGTAAFHPSVTGIALQNLPGPRVGAVVVHLSDNGKALGKPQLTVSMSGPKHYAKTQTRKLDTLLPGDLIAYPYAWPDNLGSGQYTITAKLEGGGVTASKTVHLTLKRALRGVRFLPTSDVTTIAAKSGGIPWIILPIVGVVGLGGGVLLRRRPRKSVLPVTKS